MNNNDRFDKMLTPDMVDISLEEFDKMGEEHEFSEEYKAAKKEMLKNYRKSKLFAGRVNIAKVAVAACAVIIGAPLAVNAATNGEFFARIWGNLGKKNIPSHEEEVYDEGKDTTYTVTYPQVDYEEVDEKKAEELIGENVSFESVEYTFGDGTKLNVLSTVSDGNSAIVEFTLEKEGGVDCLNYSQLDNEAKGAWFNESSNIYFDVDNCVGNIFVDLEKSTADKLYCYDYLVVDAWNQSVKGLKLNIAEFPCSRTEYNKIEQEAIENDDEASRKRYEELTANVEIKDLQLSVKEEVQKSTYTCEEDGCAVVSPLSLDIDMSKGLGLTTEEGYDPWYIYYVAVHYKDGTEYIVNEHEYEGIHSCDVEIDNAAYECGGIDESHMRYVFNRLVDVNEIDYIQVNEAKYTLR